MLEEDKEWYERRNTIKRTITLYLDSGNVVKLSFWEPLGRQNKEVMGKIQQQLESSS